MTAVEAKTCGELLRWYRRQAGLSQEELAERAELSPRGLRYLEQGERSPYPGTVRRLAEALELSDDDREWLLALAAPEQTGDVTPVDELVSSVLQTFLIADIRGYTRFSDEHGDEGAARLAQKFAGIARGIAAAWEGTVVELRGDEALVVFPSARQALRAALDLQERCAQETHTDPSLPLPVGIGLDAGEAIPVEGGYRGGALNLAARLCSLAAGGEVFCSDDVIHLARKTEGVVFVDRGEVTLKGLLCSVRVIQIGRTGQLPDSLPPLQPVLEMHPTNLPDEPTRFIGREREIDEIAHLILREDIRLLTLTGTGGTGKTRLALQVGGVVLDSFERGVYFVNLAPLADPALVASTIASTLKVMEVPGEDIRATLIAYLKDREMLLVLDNFEHLLDAAPVVHDLVVSCPQLTILVTSRALLRLSAEHSYPVPPLAVPDPGHLPDLETLTQYDAVALFVDRARAVKPGFAVTQDNARAVAAICSRLDGLPLALELAASRISLFPPPALLQRLDHRLKLLTGGAKDKPTRQQTLRSAIDWSYSLLTADDQTLFARLSVFAGGCSFEAAEEVCNPEADLDLLEGLTSLVEKSLLRQEGEQEPRFVMLETIREYASEKLAERGEADSLRTAHATSLLRLADDAVTKGSGPEQGVALARLTMEQDNLRAALQWFLERRQTEEELRLAAAITDFWDYRGHRSEGQRWPEVGLADEQAAIDPVVRSRALYMLGVLLQHQGDFRRATAYLEKSLELNREMGNVGFMAYSLNAFGNLVAGQGDYERAEALFEESARCCRDAGEMGLLASVVGNLGYAAMNREEWTRAEKRHVEALTLLREGGNHIGVCAALANLAQVVRKQGNLVRAQILAEEALALARTVGVSFVVAAALTQLGAIARDQGDQERAVALLREAEALERGVGEGRCQAWLLVPLGRTLLCAGRLDEAETVFTEALQRSQESGNQRDIARCRLGLGTVARRQGQSDEARDQLREGLLVARAVRQKELTADLVAGVAALLADADKWHQAVLLLGATVALYEQVSVVMDPAMRQESEELLTRLSARLDERTFGRAGQEGQGMSLETAVDYALEEIL